MNINDFKAELIGGGARANQYKVTMAFPTFAGSNKEIRRLTFMCKGAQIPSDVIGVIDAPFLGRQLKVPGDRTYPEWTITLLNDGEFAVRDAFERWANGISAHTENTGLDFSEILSDAKVEQLDRQGNVIKTYTLRGVFPSEVAAIDLAFDANDAIEEYTVTLQMQFWESNTTS